MNIFSKRFCFLLAGVALLMGGCPKKPNRPDPSSTVLGPGPGSVGINPIGLDAVADSDSLLEARNGVLEDANSIRGLLQPVYFDFDKSAIRSGERAKVEEAARYLSGNPGQRLLVEGYCDWRGTTEYNLGLGDRRASSIKNYLETLGVDMNRIEIVSKGDLESMETQDDGQLQQDRRAELVILK